MIFFTILSKSSFTDAKHISTLMWSSINWVWMTWRSMVMINWFDFNSKENSDDHKRRRYSIKKKRIKEALDLINISFAPLKHTIYILLRLYKSIPV